MTRVEYFNEIFERYDVASEVVDTDEELQVENDNVKMLVKLSLTFFPKSVARI